MTLKTQSIREALKAKIAAARALADQYTDKPMPDEVGGQINSLLGESDVIKAQLDQIERLEKGEQYLTTPAGTQAAHLGWRESGPDEGEVEVDAKAWRQVEVVTPAGKQEVRYHVPLAVQKQGYAEAFDGYLRKGFAGLSPAEQKTLTEGVDSAGGFLVSPDLQTELIKKIATAAVLRAYARRVQTSRDIVQWRRVVYTSDDKYTSGARLTWTGETPSTATVHRVTDPVFGLIDIPVHTAMASIPLSNNLIEDSEFDVQGYASDLLAESFALGEDDVFLNGTGVGQPMGLLTEVNTNGPAYVISGASGAITTSGDAHSGVRLVNLFYTVPSQYRQRAVWVMNSATMKEAENLVDGQKRPIVSALLTASLALGTPEVIKGRQVLIDEFVPDIAANSYPIIFGDLNGYIIVDRVGFSIQRLAELYAETNTTLLLARKRVGGYCAEPYRIKVLKAGTS